MSGTTKWPTAGSLYMTWLGLVEVYIRGCRPYFIRGQCSVYFIISGSTLAFRVSIHSATANHLQTCFEVAVTYHLPCYQLS